MNRALLTWAHENGGPDNVRTAHHIVNWAAEKMFTACTTEADYAAVALCLEISIQLIQESQNANLSPQP